LRVSHDQRCSIDVTDLADIFTVDRPNQVRKKLKISAQTVEPFWRYGRHKCEGVGYTWYTFLEPYFSINFHFLNNDKSYNRDLFTIHTIDDGLYVDGIKSIVLLDNISSVLHTIWGAAYIRATQSVYGLSQISALELIETSLI
jgi:hypothetical protein